MTKFKRVKVIINVTKDQNFCLSPLAFQAIYCFKGDTGSHHYFWIFHRVNS